MWRRIEPSSLNRRGLQAQRHITAKGTKPDNLKSGVTHPCYYDPDINPSYQEFASHYGMVVLPARCANRGTRPR